MRRGRPVTGRPLRHLGRAGGRCSIASRSTPTSWAGRLAYGDAYPRIGHREPDRHGASFDEVLAGYLDFEREDIQQAVAYAAWLTRKEVRSSWRGAQHSSTSVSF